MGIGLRSEKLRDQGVESIGKGSCALKYMMPAKAEMAW